jgi:hypothetical protein
MNLNKLAATAAMTGALGAAALGVGAGFAQADPGGHGPGGPGGPNVPGPNVPGPKGPNENGWNPGQNGPGNNCRGQGANVWCPGSPLPPGQNGFPPPGHYNDPVSYGLPPNWFYNGVNYPIVFNPDPAFNTWGIFLPGGQFVAYAP